MYESYCNSSMSYQVKEGAYGKPGVQVNVTFGHDMGFL